MKTLFAIAIGVLAAGVACAQAAPSQPAFEVASIRPAESTSGKVNAGVRMDGSQAYFEFLSLKDCIAIAYHVPASQVEGPGWIAEKRFSISAKLPDGSTVRQIPQMMQSLLAQRFQLKIHRETKLLPAYALVLGKPPLRLKASPPEPTSPAAKGGVNVAASGSAAGVSIDLGNGSSVTLANHQFEVKKVSMDVLAAQLSRYLDRPVVNTTALDGAYDLTLTVTPGDYLSMLLRSAVNAGVVLPPPALRLLDGGPPTSLFDALGEEGLRLDSRKLPLEVIVVDGALETPTPN